VSNGT